MSAPAVDVPLRSRQESAYDSRHKTSRETSHSHHHHDDHHHHHAPGCGCGAHHESSESGLKRRLSLVLAAIICLLVGTLVAWLRPGQAELAAAFSLVGALLAAAPIFRDTLVGLQARSAENTEFYMNQFMTLAVSACIISGQYLAGGVVAIVLLVGHLLEDRTLLGTHAAIASLLDLSRHRARRLQPGTGKEEDVDSDSLSAGDLIRVRPGDVFPADGIVESGHSTVDQAKLTGESVPVEVAPGSGIYAGTHNLTGMVEVRANQVGARSVIGQVQHIVEEAQATRAPIVRLTEEYARFYLPIVLAIAGSVLFFTHDLTRAISVIIVSIPCTFVMAGPAAFVAALASASRLGLLVKSVRFFEAAHRVDAVVFDKTGTLTTGRLQVQKIMPAEGESRHLLKLAAALQQHSSHPVARAICRAADEAQLSLPVVIGAREAHGLGISGEVEGEPVVAGRATWLREQGIAGLPDENSALPGTALSIGRSGRFAGTIYFGDCIRPEATGLKTVMVKLGIDRLMVLTGDRKAAADSIAAQTGISEIRAECLPAQKRDAVEALKREGHCVLVVGDGVNDAPALAAGNLSIAMGALGSDVAIHTADVALMSNDLRRIVDFLRLSDQTMAIVNQNFLGGLAFIALAVALSSAGYVSPIAAAILHETGAFFVIFNSARLLKFEASARASDA